MAKERRFIIARGMWGEVACVIRPDGSMPAREFLDSIEDEKGYLAALFDRMATHGRIPNSSRFSQEEGDIFAFKHTIRNKLVRFPCFRVGNCWVLTHGFYKPGAQKKKGKWPPEQIDRAIRLMEEFKSS